MNLEEDFGTSFHDLLDDYVRVVVFNVVSFDSVDRMSLSGLLGVVFIVGRTYFFITLLVYFSFLKGVLWSKLNILLQIGEALRTLLKHFFSFLDLLMKVITLYFAFIGFKLS